MLGRQIKVSLDRVLPIVERLRQKLNSLVAKRFKSSDLRLVHARNDRVATLARVLRGAKEKRLVALDRTAD